MTTAPASDTQRALRLWDWAGTFAMPSAKKEPARTMLRCDQIAATKAKTSPLIPGIGVKADHSRLALVVAGSRKWCDLGWELVFGRAGWPGVRSELCGYEPEPIVPPRPPGRR